MKAAKFVLASLAIVGLVACGGGKKKTDGDAPANLKGIDYPEWVNKGSGAFGGEQGRVFTALGQPRAFAIMHWLAPRRTTVAVQKSRASSRCTALL